MASIGPLISSDLAYAYDVQAVASSCFMPILEQFSQKPQLIASIQEKHLSVWDMTSMLKTSVLVDKTPIASWIHGLQQSQQPLVPPSTVDDTAMHSVIGNCTIAQFEHRTVLLPPKEDQPGWLDLTKDYNSKCVETYGAAMVS